MKPFTPILTPEQRYAIVCADITVTNAELAKRYNVTTEGIRYWRNEAFRLRAIAKRKGRMAFKQFLKNSKDPGKARAKKVKLDRYAQMIHDAIGTGIGVDELERKIDMNLSALLREKLSIENQIKECGEAQKALLDYLDVKPVMIDDSGTEFVDMRPTAHMTAKEMKIRMSECGLNLNKLAKELSGRYSERALRSYREGQVPVPKPVADILKGFPKKQILDAWR